MHTRRQMPQQGRSGLIAAVAAIFAGLTIVAAVAFAGDREPTKGRIPDEAFRPGANALDPRLIPDFVIALGRDGEPVGYVAKEALADPIIGADGRPVTGPIPVVGEDLETVVGFMYPSKGFVPIGVDPDTVPEIPADLAPLDE